MSSTFVAQLFDCSQKLFTIVNPHFFRVLIFDIFLKTLAVSVAYFVFKRFTRKCLDIQSAATHRYFMLRLYFDSCYMSTCVKSNDQISFMSFTKIFSLWNFIIIERYYVKDTFFLQTGPHFA